MWVSQRLEQPFQLAHVVGRRSLETQPFPADRMHEAQHRGVQGLPSQAGLRDRPGRR